MTNASMLAADVIIKLTDKVVLGLGRSPEELWEQYLSNTKYSCDDFVRACETSNSVDEVILKLNDYELTRDQVMCYVICKILGMEPTFDFDPNRLWERYGKSRFPGVVHSWIEQYSHACLRSEVDEIYEKVKHEIDVMNRPNVCYSDTEAFLRQAVIELTKAPETDGTAGDLWRTYGFEWLYKKYPKKAQYLTRHALDNLPKINSVKDAKRAILFNIKMLNHAMKLG